jgi:hypothetical protein
MASDRAELTAAKSAETPMGLYDQSAAPNNSA